MKPFTCPICGGQIEIKIDSDIAVCDSCGRSTKIDAEDVEQFQTIYSGAERLMRLNTAAGYEDAIRRLRPIAFIDEAWEKIIVCERRLDEKRATKQRQQETKQASEKKNTWLGIVLLILLVPLWLAMLAGVVYLVFQLINGEQSSTIVTVILIILALL